MQLRSLIVVAGIACGVGRLSAQVPGGSPSPAQLQQLQNQNLGGQLQAKIQQSGLTPDQIRARLRAAGYPESLLNGYLGRGTPTDSVPTEDQLDAVSLLGLVDSTATDTMPTSGIDSIALRNGRPGMQRMGADTSDSAYYEAYYRAYYDSLTRARAAERAAPKLPDPYVFDSLADSATMAESDSMAIDRNSKGPLAGTVLGAVTANPRNRGLVTDTAYANAFMRRRILRGPPLPPTLDIFGLNLFRQRGKNLFQPNLAGPIDANYKLGPGDQLVLILTGDVEHADPLMVTREGFVVIPQVGQVNVNNLTLAQLDDVLYARLGRVYSGVKRGPGATTHFSVSVARLRSNQVYVVGDVKEPGSYQISSAGTALTAIYAAGGPTLNGSLRRVLIRRGGALVDSLDVYDYLLHGDALHDTRLQSGDVVFVPVHGPQVKVAGEVIRPAVYELMPGETLRDALRDAGGFQAGASRRFVQITRILPPDQRGLGGHDRVVIDVSSDQLDTATGPALPLFPGDSVRVFAIAPRVHDRITVSGDVWQPGPQGLAPGMRLSDALKVAGGVKPDAYLGQVLIARMQPDSTRQQLRSALRDTSGTPTDDIFLKEDDDIRIFSVRDFRPRRYVAIAGAVRKSGRFQYHDGMTMRDIVLLAGGVTDGAYLQEAEIARLPENRAGGVTATTIRVPLDSTYLFERNGAAAYRGPPGVQVAAAGAPEVTLQPYDNVLILREPDFQLPRTVVVGGEVAFPGRYTLTRKTERLSDVIGRAGGVTKAAYAEGMMLYRHLDRTGRVGADLPAALDDPKSRDNLILQDGDSLFVPTYSGIVRVAGEVNAPTAIAYVSGQDINYYIRAAGGPGRKADVGRAYVTQPNGKVQAINHHFLLPDNVPQPKPGAAVYVPEKEFRANEVQTAQYLLLAAQVVGSLATIIIVARQHP